MLLLENNEKEKRESECFLYCIDTAFDLVGNREFAKAASYYENAARSLRELDKLKEANQELLELSSGVKQLTEQEFNNWLKGIKVSQ